MAKIPFDIKYRPQIESGEYKVETRDGRKARIIHWDLNCTSPIVAVMDAHIDIPGEIVDVFSVSGRAFDDLEFPSDLFIVTPEEELSEWEKAVGRAITDAQLIPRDKDGVANIHDIDEFIKSKAAELLSLAKDEIYSHENLVEYAEKAMAAGKAEALKDLPRWEKYPHNAGSEPLVNGILQKDGSYKWRLYLDGYKIEISDLEKLPGFKEDEK